MVIITTTVIVSVVVLDAAAAQVMADELPTLCQLAAEGVYESLLL